MAQEDELREYGELYKGETYRASIPDLDYYLRQIDCRDGCPVHTDGRGYMMAIHAGNFEQGYRIARGPNPFASICGMICAAPCEITCRRDRVDKTLTIRALKRYLDDWYGVDAKAHIKALDYSYARGSTSPKPNGLKIGCVGAGVASLTVAHDLLRLGYSVDIYEMLERPGGMLVYGVPNYRLKNELIAAEIAAIEHLGARIFCNMKVGRDITLDELSDRYDALFIGNGLWKSRELPIEGAEGEDVIRGIEYLKILCEGSSYPIGRNMVVIGGGNVAFDVARSSARNGAKSVKMICLESRYEQTADEFEIEDGIEEGVEIYNRVGPKAIVRDQKGKICGVKVQKVTSLYDAQGGFAPTFEGEEQLVPCDCVALAIGQAMDLSLFGGWSRREELVMERGVIKCERGTGRTSIPGIYCGGDAGYGAALFITAIAQGQESARAIDADLRGTQPYREFSAEFLTIPAHRDKEYLKRQWQLPSLQPSSERTKTMNIVENGFTHEEAFEQSSRCLQCHVSPIFEGSLCIKCNGCVDVCPTNCLKQVPLYKLEMDAADGSLRSAVDHFYEVDSASMEREELASLGSAMLKDEDLCIRCGLCAEKCPTEAVTMDMMNYSFRWMG